MDLQQQVETAPRHAVVTTNYDSVMEVHAPPQELVHAWFCRAAVPVAAIGRVLVPMENWSAGYDLQIETSKPFVIVLVCEDGLFYVRVSEVRGSIVPRSGCSDLDEDALTCIAIPVKQFHPLDLATSLFAQ